MFDKNACISRLLELEGGYVNDPSDSGGETNFGITLLVARENGYSGKMREMEKCLAFDIYAKTYWEGIAADTLLKISPKVAEEVFDTGVNMGPGKAIKSLQRCLNALNNRQRYYDDIATDGKMGAKSLHALGEYLARREEGVLLKALNCLQGAAYIELSERREKDEKFLYGWLKNRVEL